MSAMMKQGTLMSGIATRCALGSGDVIIMASSRRQLQDALDRMYPGAKLQKELTKRAIIVSAETLEGGAK